MFQTFSQGIIINHVPRTYSHILICNLDLSTYIFNCDHGNQKIETLLQNQSAFVCNLIYNCNSEHPPRNYPYKQGVEDLNKENEYNKQ